MPALYTSLRLGTAWIEAQQGFAFKAQPMTVCAYRVDCEDVADLTDRAVRTDLLVSAADLACAWEDLAARGVEPPTWALTRRLARDGIAAILVPSLAAGATEADRNLVFWRWSGAPPHQVTVVDADGRLPNDDRSWGNAGARPVQSRADAGIGVGT